MAAQSTDPGNAWQVQIRTASWPGAVSITTELGALVGDDRVTFAIGRESLVHVDGAPDTVLRPGVAQTIAGGMLTEVSDGAYRLDLYGGESITVIDRGTYLDWTVALGPHDGPGSVRGLLGSNTGQTNDDFQLPDGTVLPQPLSEAEILSTFADAWTVAPGTSLLDETNAPSIAILESKPNHFVTSPDSHTGGTDITLTQGGTPNDFSGDGKSDLLWQNGGTFTEWQSNGGAFTPNTVVGSVGLGWTAAGVGDFNGDGKADILWRDAAGDVGLWQMNGPAVTSTAMIGRVPTNWTIAGTGDFNGDGRADILWRDTAGDVGIWEMNGPSVIAAAGIATVPTNWVISAVGDFNGDGKADILWNNTTTGDVGVWEMNGLSAMGEAGVGKPGPNWKPVGTGDYNGDGKADILFQKTDGMPMIWSMNGTIITATTTLTDPGQNWHAKTG